MSEAPAKLPRNLIIFVADGLGFAHLSASHDADFDRLLRGMQAIEASLEILLDFAAEEGETLVVFTSDHETGGLALGAGVGGNTRLKSIWTTSGHTGTVVPVLAFGPGASTWNCRYARRASRTRTIARL